MDNQLESNSPIRYCLDLFEETVYMRKKKFSANERLLFIAGLYYHIIFARDIEAKCRTNPAVPKNERFQAFVEVMAQMRDELQVFAESELMDFHKFFCEKCEAGLKHGEA